MLSQFNSLSDAKTIYFSVRDRENYQANQRKDSLLDFDGVRQQRTKSEYVESGGSFCVNTMVQHMLAHFKIQCEKPVLGSTLQVIKALHYFYNHLWTFTNEGLKFILPQSPSKDDTQLLTLR